MQRLGRQGIIAIPTEPVRPALAAFLGGLALVLLLFSTAAPGTEYLEIAEDLNLRIMEIVEGESASFALPGRMIYGTPLEPQAKGV